MTPKQRIEIFKKASLCRNFEEVVYTLIQEKRFKYPIYLSAGQEFIPATLSLFYEGIKPAIFAQHRCHHTYLSFGGDIIQLIDELLGRPNGCSGGMGGSASVQSKKIKMFGHDGLMGTQIPIALGYAISSKSPTFSFMGDAAAEEDYAMSSIAWASTKHAPILFIIEDNNLSILTEKKVRRNWEHKPFAEALGLKAFDIEDDPTELWSALETIGTNFPALLNVRTVRLFWHAGAGQDTYERRDRYAIELNEIGEEAMNIHKETRAKIEKIWQEQLETQ
jgi:acetoin:2,6-dichlorophenolindophenol oxidoreductase subunit alpha